MQETKQKILECIDAACSHAEDLNVDSDRDEEFVHDLDRLISDLFEKLGNRIIVLPKDITASDDSFSVIKRNVRTEVALRTIMDQIIGFAMGNFISKLEVEEIDDPVIKTIASTVNMMGEELQSKLIELQGKNLDLEDLSQKLEIKNQELKSVTKALYESTLVSITDLRGKITEVNDSFCEVSKYDREELIGQPHRIVNSGYHPGTFWEDMWQTILSGSYWRGDVKNKAKDGTVYWVDTTINPLKDVNGNITHFFSIRNLITERKDQEQKLMENDKTIREALIEKNVLLQEVHHRVKNNLQIITGLISMQANRTESAETIIQLNESQRRIGAIALIHEKLYQSENMAQIDISEYTSSLSKMVSSIYDRGNPILVEYDIEENIVLNMQRAIPYGLLLNEVISNANKHAYKGGEQGVISVSLKARENSVRLRVKDNGNGMDVNIPPSQRKSLGMKLIHSLALQLKADLTIKNENGLLIELEIRDYESIGGMSVAGGAEVTH